jgi:hypothetical protein
MGKAAQLRYTDSNGELFPVRPNDLVPLGVYVGFLRQGAIEHQTRMLGTTLAFVPASGQSRTNAGLTFSAEGQVRVYDSRLFLRRPRTVFIRENCESKDA